MLFNERHDWNSLLSDNDTLKFTRYSDKYFPHADDYVRYLSDYASTFNLNIHYNTKVEQIAKMGRYMYMVKTSKGKYKCEFMLMANGLSKPKTLEWFNEDIVMYSNM